MNKQLIAKHPLSGMTIIQRLINGVRYYKVTPKNLSVLIFNQIKSQFINQEVNVQESNGWLRVEKLKKIKKFEQVSAKALEKEGVEREDLNEDYILNKEAEILKKQGFNVVVRGVRE